MDHSKVFFVIVGLFLTEKTWAMSRTQLKNTVKLMKNSCIPKHDVTEDMVGSIEQGKFMEERNVMCYMGCIYQMIGCVKNGKMNYEASIKMIDLMFPPELKEPTKKTATLCKDVTKDCGNDLCEAAYRTAKCMYEADPANFFFA